MTVFIVEGVDTDDGSRTLLSEHSSSAEAYDWYLQYILRGDAGGWDLIEVYDVRGEPERLWFWERPDDRDES